MALFGCGGWIWTNDLQVMSLTSYRAAPPRVIRFLYLIFIFLSRYKKTALLRRLFDLWDCEGFYITLNRSGSDLLFRALRRSTIGTKTFHFRVRDGTGWDNLVITTRSIKSNISCLKKLCKWAPAQDQLFYLRATALSSFHGTQRVPGTKLKSLFWSLFMMRYQVDWVISTGQLHALLRFHIQPINVVVFHGS